MKYDIVEDDIKIENKIIYCVDKDIISIIHSLEQQNQELKKQLEESKDNYNCLLKQKEQFEYIMSKQVDYRGQQKEFIEYMEEKIICYENHQNTNLGEYERNLYFDLYNDILEKYKEIIGGK